jgi:hypothetical protein
MLLTESLSGREICVEENLFNSSFLITWLQFESSFKNKTTKFQALHVNFYKEKATSLHTLQGTSYTIIIWGTN